MARFNSGKADGVLAGTKRKERLTTKLARWAGLVDQPSFESLEQRQMLFSLTVTADDVNPNTGLGTVQAYFAYVIPALARNDTITQQTPQVTTEDFNDDVPGAVGSGQFFTGSAIRAVHNIVPPADFAVRPPDLQQSDRWLRVSLKSVGDFFEFQFYNDATNPQFARRVLASAVTVLPDIPPDSPAGDSTGLFIDQMRVTLRNQATNAVVATYTGAQIRNFFVQAGGGNSALGTGTYNFTPPQGSAGFDTIRFELIGAIPQGNIPAFRIDTVTYTTRPSTFDVTIENRIFGAVATLTGPVGASATFLDLYGRDMVRTYDLGKPTGADFLLVDPDDNGVPDFNDGIGSITITGVDERAAFSLWGGSMTATDTRPDNVDAFDGLFAFTIADDIVGTYDDFEQAGFGYAYDLNGQTLTVTGLPPGPGSVIVGAPTGMIRPQNNYRPGGVAPGSTNPVTTGFNDPTQGIKVNGSIGSVYIHGIVHGSSEITGYAGSFYAGYMLGSLNVAGDLGALVVGTDAGMWQVDPGFTTADPNVRIDPVNKTGGQLIVGRTVGEILIAGRSQLDVTVVGDLSSPTTRPPRNNFVYDEKEFIFGVATTVDPITLVRNNNNNTATVASNSPTALFRANSQAYVFGDTYFRNDSILGAEWIGSSGTGVRVRGELSGQDPINSEDTADVYAFAVDGTQDVVVEGVAGQRTPYFRLVDQDGRTLAAAQSPGGTSRNFQPARITYRPNGPGVIYLVVSDPNGNDTNVGNTSYTVVVTDMAPTALGAYRTGGGSGFTDVTTGEGNSVVVLAGGVGSLRIGTGYVGADGADADPTATFNTSLTADDEMSWQGGAFVVTGNLYNITAGSDISPPNANQGASPIDVRVSGDFGTLYSGLSGVASTPGPNSGDLAFFNLTVGGRIASLDVRGGVGMDQDATDPRARRGTNIVNIRTGTNGGNGDIGFIRVGFHVAGDSMNITTSPGSVLGGLMVSQDVYTDTDQRSGIYAPTNGGVSVYGIHIISGFGSDVRFVDAPNVDLLNSRNVRTLLTGDAPAEFVDDSGARVRIGVENGPTGTEVGRVRVLPIDGSQGVAIGAIEVDLSGGRVLTIEGVGTSSGVVSIGHIIITNADANSEIQIRGNVQVDVYRIEQTGGTGMNIIANTTPGGDIVSADVVGVNTVQVFGDIGRTQVPSWGPQKIGIYLGVAADLGTAVGDPIGTGNGDQAPFDNGQGGGGGGTTPPVPLLDRDFNGNAFRPITDDNFDTGNAYLDDIGSPVNPQLNGFVVRTGGVLSVEVRGAVGDFILQSSGGTPGDGTDTLALLSVNSDHFTALGRFDGIIGTILATNITRIEIGDGLAASNGGPMATAGIFALNDIGEIIGQQGGSKILGVINASNITDGDRAAAGEVDGIGSITLNSGEVRDAIISSRQIDGFWHSFNYNDDEESLGNLGNIQLNSTNLFRSSLWAREVQNVRILGGYFDASTIAATQRIGTISAAGFRNSTLTGQSTEVAASVITGARDLERITSTGEMSDLTIDITGRVINSISAAGINRSTIDVDGEIKALTVTGNLRATSVTAGSLPSLSVTGNIVSADLAISAQISSVTAATITNSRITSTGPGGSIGTIAAPGGVSGEIRSVGPIGTISASAGDVNINLVTTDKTGNVQSITAARDVAVTGDIGGNLATITAGRNFGVAGSTGVLVVRGDISQISIPGGQLFYDLRAGGTITNATIGGAVNKPGSPALAAGSLTAFRNIGTVTVNGDFNGSITSYTGGIASVTINNGSFLRGNAISAYDGSIGSVIINNGSLYGNIYADYDLTSLRVVAGTDGVFGDIGINPDSSAFTSYDSRRNQLPAGIFNTSAVDGPRISAGYNIVSITVTGGSVFESTFLAGRAIRSIAITGSVSNDPLTTATFGSVFGAGDSIDSITVTGNVSNTAFVAGLVALGSDNRLGGVGSAADSVKSGNIGTITVGGNVSNTAFAAGTVAGADGVYNTSDDLTAFGLSTITKLGIGSIGPGVSAYADSFSASVAADNRYYKTTSLPNANPLVDSGAGTPGTSFTGSRTFNISGGSVTINFTGAGQAFFDAGTNRLTLRNTTSASSVTVSSSTGTLDSFDIVTNDDASLGTISIQAALTGNSDIIVDGGVGTLTVGNVSGNGRFQFGADVGTATFASFAGGYITGRAFTALRINGDYGAANQFVLGEAFISALDVGTLAITGKDRANISVDRNIAAFSASAGMQNAILRAGSDLISFTTGSMNSAYVSVGNTITTATIGGSMTDGHIMAGFDLGNDAAFGGTGLAADVVTSGFIGTVTVSGDFLQSDITAGYARGADSFFGTSDDTIAAGRSTISTVTITGRNVGSPRSTESYVIGAAGSVGSVRIGGGAFTGTTGNFSVVAPNLPPLPAQVSDIRVSVESLIYTANIVFNQPIDASSLHTALNISEVRGLGDIQIRLIEGIDYTIAYNATTFTAAVTFSRTLTSADLPAVPGKPGPGIYRFDIAQSLFRAQLQNYPLDGNADGFTQPNDNFTGSVAVGDVGDKLTAGTTTTNGHRVDFYAPSNLDFVLQNAAAPNGLPQTNRTVTVRGFIGDHPDNDANSFRFAGDTDLYSITLQAGQIIRLSALEGSAVRAGLSLIDPTGATIAPLADNNTVVSLPVPAAALGDNSFPLAYLIKQTGTYVIGVGTLTTIGQTNTVNNPAVTPPLSVGDYRFTVQVFDDGDSGFTSSTDSGDGTNVVNAPAPITFAGGDGVFGTADDLASQTIGEFTFTWSRGADNLPNTADDVVTGDNGTGITSTTTGAGVMTSTIRSSIGPAGHAGIPSDIAADVDVFHLNNRLPITPGTKMKITVKLADLGADLGSINPATGADNRGTVQFGLFDTSASTSMEDATMVFSPTDFRSFGGTPNTVIADNGSSKYGYDAKGDFYIEFVAPDRMGVPGSSGTFALYIQGVYNTDYAVEVVTGGTGAVQQHTQNVFIEANGGVLDWLAAGGLSTSVSAFDPHVLGFSGTASNGQPVRDYILQSLVSSLNTLFQEAAGTGLGGFDVRFSLNPADFTFQPFSTVYVSSTNDSLAPIFNPFDSFNFLLRSGNFVSTQPYGFSQHSDPFNTNLTDEAVVFTPSFALQGLSPSQADIDNFVQSLTAAVARRTGELMGLRISAANANGAATFDPFAGNSVDVRPGTGRSYTVPQNDRALSTPFDSVVRTDFFLGRQNAFSLLDKVLGRV